MEENERKKIRKVKKIEGRYIKKLNIKEIKVEGKREEKPTVRVFSISSNRKYSLV